MRHVFSNRVKAVVCLFVLIITVLTSSCLFRNSAHSALNVVMLLSVQTLCFLICFNLETWWDAVSGGQIRCFCQQCVHLTSVIADLHCIDEAGYLSCRCRRTSRTKNVPLTSPSQRMLKGRWYHSLGWFPHLLLMLYVQVRGGFNHKSKTKTVGASVNGLPSKIALGLIFGTQWSKLLTLLLEQKINAEY